MRESRSIDLVAARRQRWRRIVPLTAAAIAVMVAAVALQVVDYYTEQSSIDDPLRGWALRPGYRGWAMVENSVWFEVNSDGLRDREHPLVTPPSTVRVALLGDSYMQAPNLPFEKIMTPLLEQRLDNCVRGKGRHGEVINFGVVGYGTGQELMTFQQHASRYRPDVVVLAMYTGNDILDNQTELREAASAPFFDLQNGRPVWHPGPEAPAVTASWHQRVRLAITDRVLLARRIWDVYGRLRARFLPVPAIDVTEASGLDSEPTIYAPPADPRLVEAWRVTEALVLEFARQVAAAGSEFWIVTLSNAEQVTPDLEARRALARHYGVDSLMYPDERIRDLARAHGIPIVTLVQPLADYAARTGEWLNGAYNEAYPRGTGHWNETAHRLAADIVGDRLCADSVRLTQ